MGYRTHRLTEWSYGTSCFRRPPSLDETHEWHSYEGASCNTKWKEDKDVKGLDSIYPTLYVKVVEHYSGKISEQQGNKHALGNLTLLDTALNRSYQDAPFPYKRQCVMDTDLRGDKFVPMCTKNVFLKFYTNSNSSASFLDSMRWNKQDQDNYLAAIHKVVDTIFETNI